METTNIKVESNTNPKYNKPDTDSYTIEVMGMPIWAKLHFKKSFGKVRDEVHVTPYEFEMNIHAKDVDDFAPEVLKEMSREINKELRDMNDMSSPDARLSKSDKVQKAFSKAFEGRDWDDFIKSQKPEFASEAESRDARGLEDMRGEDKMIAMGGLWLTLTAASAFFITGGANASTAIVEAASNPDTASMFMESLKTGLDKNIEHIARVKEIISNSEIPEMMQNTLSSIQETAQVAGENVKGATDTVKETAQVAAENVKGALDKLKGLMPGQT